MKLYASVQSERATKGQGGEWLDIRILDADKVEVARFYVRDCPEGILIRYDHDRDCVIMERVQGDCGCEQGVYACREHAHEKGERRKGESFIQQLADHKHDAVTKFR